MKFKEPRLLSICAVAFIGMVILAIHAASQHETAKLIITVVLSLMALTMMLGRFNILVKEDFMLVYAFRYIGILPVMIDYIDLKEVELVSKTKVKMKTTKQDLSVYILNASKFVSCLKEHTKKLELEVEYR
ncbi:hypothetical protein [Beduini massiliensis]|uniref:hypothetical protein n=1 Tax=Beduini massiliensis TaxID=1585974 RepID=UPI00059A8A26|nr:hypothetical protein [Beduini massiliensis]